MKVENSEVARSAVSKLNIRLAEDYGSTKEMVKDGKEIGDKGFNILAAGLGGMLVGGSIGVLAGKRGSIYKAGRAVWGAGVLATAVGTGRFAQGEIIRNSGEKISKAVRNGRANIT